MTARMGRYQPEWDGSTLVVDEQRFLVAVFHAALSDADRFVIWKTRPLLEATIDLVERLDATRIVELGIAQGGSTALLALRPGLESLLAVDLADHRIEALDRFLDQRSLTQTRVEYGIDQANRAGLQALVRETTTGPIDLVLDDASHQLDATRASFDALFPLLRPGGVYAVEDWDWGHLDSAADLKCTAGGDGWWPGGEPLTHFAFEATVATADPEVVRAVEIDRHLLRITRGSANLHPETFRLRDHLPHAGRALLTPH